MDDPHRESCRRQHQVLDHFLAVQAWLRGLDCIVLVRHDLKIFLDLVRFKSTRIEWLLEDLRPWFPFQVPFYKANAESSLHSLFLSRVPIEEFLSGKGNMTVEQLINEVIQDGPNTARLSYDKDGYDPPSESHIVRYLAILDSGLDNPSLLRVVKRRKNT